MTRYVTIPVEVDAFQFLAKTDKQRLAKALEEAPNVVQVVPDQTSDLITVRTVSGTIFVLGVGDWLIRRPDGSCACVPAHVFGKKFTRLLG